MSVIDEGPACGSLEALTYLMVVYQDDAGIQFIDEWYCCHRHVPHPKDLLPQDAEFIEVVIADSRYTTVAADGFARTMTFESAGPGEIPLVSQP